MYYEIVETKHPEIENMTVVDWLWPGYLARGHLHILAGSPGCGKTQLALNIASIISEQGRKFPGGKSNTEEGAIIMWSGEDSLTDTIIPRLVAAECKMSNFHYITGVQSDSGDISLFNPPLHLEALKIKIGLMNNVKLLIIDPIASMITGEGNSNPQVRANLVPLVQIAHQFNIAVLGIHHLTKGTEGRPLHERVSGSIAMAALARIVMIAGEDGRENAPSKYVFGKAKANITTSNEGFSYNVKPVIASNSKISIETTAIAWGQELDVPLSEALKIQKPFEQIAPSLSKIQQAADLILDSLKKEPLSWLFLSYICQENKISTATARVARDRLKSGGVIEIDFGKEWGQTPKWKLKDKLAMSEEPFLTPNKSGNTGTSDNLLNNNISDNNKVVNTSVSVARLADCQEAAIYSSKSEKGLIYNEPFEDNEGAH